MYRCIARSGKLDRARSRLYRSLILQVNMRLKALAEIYTMHFFAQLCNLIFLSKRFAKFARILNLARRLKMLAIFGKILAIFSRKVMLEQCKGVHRVDLGESFQTHI